MFNKLVFFVKESWLLIVSSVLFGFILALTNSVWGPRIAENQRQKFDTQARLLLKDAERFESVAENILVDVGKPQPQIVDVKKGLDNAGNLVGWAFMAEGAGFADKIQLVVAVNAGFDKLAGYSVLSSSETPGFGDKIALPGGYYQSQFHDLPLQELVLQKSGDPGVIDENIVAISGATVSSQAVVNILNNYTGKVKDKLAEMKLLQK